MITTVTLNPMLDKTVRVKQLSVGAITRAEGISSIVGGKGVNVARQLHTLGCDTLATGVWGGEVGLQLDRLLTAENIPHDFVPIEGMTREGVTYLDSDGVMTSVFEPAQKVTGEDSAALMDRCRALIGKSSWVACCGSSPGAACDSLFANIIREARARNVRTALDTYGKPLHLGLDAVPDIVKVNRDEYRNTIGIILDAERHIVDALLALVEQGVGLAILTDGARPCYAASNSGCWKIVPPAVSPVNSTGSGDSMLAGILYGLSKDWDVPKSVCFGAAAGAANASMWDVSSVSLERIVALLPSTSVFELDFS
jgi:1-phosphofructokinase family hexose kinase